MNLSETSTNHANNPGQSNGFSNDATSSGPVAGVDKKLFKGSEDLLSQDFQTAAEPGLNKWSLGSGVYPVMKTTLRSNLGDGPSVDAMVAASKRFVNTMDEGNVRRRWTMFAEKIDYADSKLMKRYDDENKRHKQQDDRMKYGKFVQRAKEAKNRLKPGEVKKFDKEKGKWVSNKD